MHHAERTHAKQMPTTSAQPYPPPLPPTLHPYHSPLPFTPTPTGTFRQATETRLADDERKLHAAMSSAAEMREALDGDAGGRRWMHPASSP